MLRQSEDAYDTGDIHDMTLTHLPPPRSNDLATKRIRLLLDIHYPISLLIRIQDTLILVLWRRLIVIPQMRIPDPQERLDQLERKRSIPSTMRLRSAIPHCPTHITVVPYVIWIPDVL